MVLFLKMDQNNWAKGDFTNSATFDLSGTVYDDNTFTTVRDISGFTGTFRIIDQEGGTIFSSDDVVTLNSNGTFLVKFLESQRPMIAGIFLSLPLISSMILVGNLDSAPMISLSMIIIGLAAGRPGR